MQLVLAATATASKDAETVVAQLFTCAAKRRELVKFKLGNFRIAAGPAFFGAGCGWQTLVVGASLFACGKKQGAMKQVSSH